MTTPTIPTTGAGRILGVQTAAETGTTHTFPSLSSLTKNAGDLLIAIVFLYDGNTTNAEFSGWGGGFTEFGDFATATTLSIGCAYKFSTGSETGTFTVTSSGSGRAALILMSIAGAHASTPPEAGGYASGLTSAADPGALNPTGWDVEDTLWIACASTGETSTSGSYTNITAAPASYTNMFYQVNADDVVGSIDGAVAFRGNAVASENPGTFTNDTSNTRWGALTIAVRPAPVAQAASISPVIIPLTPVALTRSSDTVLVPISHVVLTLTPVSITGQADPDPPNLQVDVVGDTASLTWDASPTPDVSGYDIFRRTPPTGADFDPEVDVAVAMGVATLTYDDVDLPAGSYDWQVFGLVGPVGPFSPEDIPGLQAWYDTSNAGSITASSGAVSQLKDLSGNGRHLGQGTGINQPISGTKTQNGLNAISFNGYGQYMTGWGSATLPQPYTVAVVARWDADNYHGEIFQSTGGTTGRLFICGSGISNVRMNAGIFLNSSNSTSLGVPAQITAIFNSSGSELRLDGISTIGNAWTDGITGPLSISIPADGGINGVICELVFYNKILNEAELTVLETYLNEKWISVPEQITGLRAWYDTSRLESIVISSGGLVSSLKDLSGNGYHLTQATSTNQPITGTRTQNSINVLDLPGVAGGAQYKMSTNAIPSTAQPFTIAVVGKHDGPGGGSSLLLPGWGSTGAYKGWSYGSLSGGSSDFNPHVFLAVINGGSSKLRVDGVQIASGTTDSGNMGVSTWIGGDGDGNHMDGWLSEVIIWLGDQTSNFATIEAYLKEKWGTP